MSKRKKNGKPPGEQPVEEATAIASSPTVGRRQLRILLIFASGFVVLLVGYLMLKADDASAPSAVATVSGANGRAVTISKAALRRAVERKAKRPLRKVPHHGNKHLDDLQAAALSELIEEIWYSEEAEALGISVTFEEIADKLAQIKAKKYPTEASYERYLKGSRLTPKDFEGRIRHQILSAKVKEQWAGSGLQGGDQFAAEFLFSSELERKWKPKTKCAPEFLNTEGSGGIRGAGYILEQVCSGASNGEKALEESFPELKEPKIEKPR